MNDTVLAKVHSLVPGVNFLYILDMELQGAAGCEWCDLAKVHSLVPGVNFLHILDMELQGAAGCEWYGACQGAQPCTRGQLPRRIL